MEIGRKIFYDAQTGEKIYDTGERSGDAVIDLTVDEWFDRIVVLKERTRETVAVMELGYGEYAADFMQASGVRVDVTAATPALVFSYPDPTTPGTPPVYVKPLSEELAAVKTENAQLRQQMAQQNADFTAFTDFYFEKNPEQA